MIHRKSRKSPDEPQNNASPTRSNQAANTPAGSPVGGGGSASFATPEAGSRSDSASSAAPPEMYYTVRSPWAWVLHRIANSEATLKALGCTSMMEVSTPKQLPSAKLGKNGDNKDPETPAHQRRRSTINRKGPVPCTLRIELSDSGAGTPGADDRQPQQQQFNGPLRQAIHGTSAAFDGLEDKDELVRTIQRCRCEELNLSPPSILIKWDVTKDECTRTVGARLPTLHEDGSRSGGFAVLKAPLGSRGEGIYFVSTIDEMHEIIEDSRKRTLEAGPEFLDSIIDQKGRIPSWVLQAEIHPAMLIHSGRKFHIRTYVAAVEKLYHEDILDAYIYNRHEIRIAAHPVSSDDETARRDRLAHITNGAMGLETERVLLSNVEELVKLNTQERVELFVAEAFGKHFMTDMVRRVAFSARQDQDNTNTPFTPRKFAIAGLDIMLTQDGRIYLLEVNVNPAAPPEGTVQGEFKTHLVGFMTDLMSLVLGRRIEPLAENKFVGVDNWVPVVDILQRKG